MSSQRSLLFSFQLLPWRKGVNSSLWRPCILRVNQIPLGQHQDNHGIDHVHLTDSCFPYLYVLQQHTPHHCLVIVSHKHKLSFHPKLNTISARKELNWPSAPATHHASISYCERQVLADGQINVCHSSRGRAGSNAVNYSSCTHWGRYNMTDIPQTTFPNGFLSQKMSKLPLKRLRCV